MKEKNVVMSVCFQIWEGEGILNTHVEIRALLYFFKTIKMKNCEFIDKLVVMMKVDNSLFRNTLTTSTGPTEGENCEWTT